MPIRVFYLFCYFAPLDFTQKELNVIDKDPACPSDEAAWCSGPWGIGLKLKEAGIQDADALLAVADDKAMETNKDQFSAFERLMDEARIYRDLRLTYSDICKLAGADPAALEGILMQELGFRGQELVDRYRAINPLAP